MWRAWRALCSLSFLRHLPCSHPRSSPRPTYFPCFFYKDCLRCCKVSFCTSSRALSYTLSPFALEQVLGYIVLLIISICRRDNFHSVTNEANANTTVSNHASVLRVDFELECARPLFVFLHTCVCRWPLETRDGLRPVRA